MLLEAIALANLLLVLVTSIFVVRTMRNAQNMVETTVFALKDEVFDWFRSEEGMLFVGDLGKLFAAGAMTQFKMPKQDGSMKLFGYKVPQQIISAILGKVFGSGGAT